MTSLLPFSFDTSGGYVIDKKLLMTKIKVEDTLPKDEIFVTRYATPFDTFTYPPLKELRMQFEATGLYDKKQIDEMLASYERLPKYRARSNRAPRSRKRST